MPLLSWRRSGVLAAPLLVLAGCTSYQARPLDLSAESAVLSRRDLAGFAVGDARTQTAFDLSDGLDERELVAVALHLNPDLATQRAALGYSEAALIEAGIWPNPELGLSVRGGSPGVDADLDLLFALLRPGERSARKQAAVAGQKMSLADLAAEEWAMVAQVRHALLDLLAADTAHRALTEATTVSQKANAAQIGRRDLGEATDLDVASTAWDLAEARRAERESEAAAAGARRRLNRLLGLPPMALLTISGLGEPILVPDPSDSPPNDLAAAILASRWDIASAKAAYEQAEQELRLAVAKQYPALHIGPSASRDGDGTTIGAGISLELPLFDRNQGGIAAALAKRDEMRARAVALLHSLIADGQDAVADLQRASAEAAALDSELMPAARRAMDLADQALHAREMSQLDYLTARRQWFVAQKAQLDAITACGHALIDLDAILGRGPITNINPVSDQPTKGTP